MTTQPDGPLSTHYKRPEFTDDEVKQADIGSPMAILDVYYSASKLTLRERIDQQKEFLQDYYYEITLGWRHSVTEKQEHETLGNFERMYSTAFERVKPDTSAINNTSTINDTSATNSEKILRNESFLESFDGVKENFPKALMWLISADKLEKSNFPERSWSTLLELKSVEHILKDIKHEAIEFNKSKEMQRRGKNKKIRNQHLKKEFIELLAKPPNGIWNSKTDAAKTLAPKILEFHENSTHSSVFHKSEEALQQTLYNWLRTGEAAEVYKNNS